MTQPLLHLLRTDLLFLGNYGVGLYYAVVVKLHNCLVGSRLGLSDVNLNLGVVTHGNNLGSSR